MAFQLAVNQELLINGVTYRVAAHPMAPHIPYGQEGREAVVYQIAAGDERRALKVFKPRYRIPALVERAKRLAPFAELPGLEICHRIVLTPPHHRAVVQAYPDLLYAVVMAWIAGPTWMEVVGEKRALTSGECLTLARGLAEILTGMEERGLAHCDLSGSNVLLPALTSTGAGANPALALVDMEQLYGPGLDRPALLAGGSPGYAHRTAPQGVWEPTADRFAGAVLLGEMLGWCSAPVREAAWGEHYFDPAELQHKTDRSQMLLSQLHRQWGPEVAALFELAWQSETLLDCPTFGEWLVSLPEQAILTQPEEGQQVIVPSTPRPVSSENGRIAPPGPRKPREHAELISLETAADVAEIAIWSKSLVGEVAFAPNNQWLAMAAPAGVYLWSGHKGTDALLCDLGGWAWSLAFDSNSEILAIGGLDCRVRLWRLAERRVGQVLEGHHQWVRGVAFSADGRILASASEDGTVRLWRVANGALLRTLQGQGGGIRNVTFAPDGETLAAAGKDGTACLWRVQDGTLIRAFKGTASAISSVAFAPNGEILAAASEDGTVRLWRVAHGELLGTLEGHTAGVSAVAFAPDGEILVSASKDRMLNLWRVADGKSLRTLEGHTNWIWSVAFAPNGRALASASRDQTVRLWGIS